MPNGKTKCYSYIRWSSERQEQGSSYDRQMRIAKEVVEQFKDEHNLELVQYRPDEGVSAFKGTNAESGRLGEFIRDVEQGSIPSNSWLIIENLDRLTRMTPRKALQLFERIIELGITIVTGTDRKVYNLQSIDDNPFELMSSIMSFSRGHEESKIKSKRTYGHALSVIAKHEQGQRSDDGNAFAIKSVGTNVWWSDCSDGFVRPHPVYYDVAKGIIDMAANKNMGSHSIVRWLNENVTAPLPKSKRLKGLQGVWSLNRINQFLKSRAMLGEKVINIDGNEHVLKDYYPKLCDEVTYYRIRHLRQQRNIQPKHTNRVYLFLGNKMLFCGHCGSGMTSHTDNRMVDEDGKVIKYQKFRYKCMNTKAKCRNWTFNATWLDDTVLRIAANHVFRPHNQAQELDTVINSLNEQLADKRQQQENITNFIRNGAKSKSLGIELSRLEIEVDQIHQQLEAAKYQRETELTDTVVWDDVDERVLDYEQSELRQQVKEKIRATVKRVIAIQVKPALIKFYITFINDVTIVAYRSSMTLAFDGKAWNELGDFYRKAIPVSKQEQYQFHSFIDNLALELDDGSIIDKAALEAELGACAKYVIEPPVDCFGENTHYEYRGIAGQPDNVIAQLANGAVHNAIAHDLARNDHLINWANGMTGAPKVIEDQFQVYKHKYKNHVRSKAKKVIYYIDGIKI